MREQLEEGGFECLMPRKREIITPQDGWQQQQ
jgi:hypothetical protein